MPTSTTPDLTLTRLTEDVSAVCPNEGCGYNPDGSYRVDYAETATSDQIAAADLVVANFDDSPEAQAAWEAEKQQDAAIAGGNTSKTPEAQTRRAMDREIHDQLKALTKAHNNIAPPAQQVPEVSWQETVDLANQRIEDGNA